MMSQKAKTVSGSILIQSGKHKLQGGMLIFSSGSSEFVKSGSILVRSDAKKSTGFISASTSSGIWSSSSAVIKPGTSRSNIHAAGSVHITADLANQRGTNVQFASASSSNSVSGNVHIGSGDAKGIIGSGMINLSTDNLRPNSIGDSGRLAISTGTI
jgi:hypothetical protein